MSTANRPMGSRVLGFLALAVVLAIALAAGDLLVLHGTNGPVLNHHYYMALGDSLSFGYQPNLNFTDGFTEDILRTIQLSDDKVANTTQGINYACAGETTTTMVHGSCIGRFGHHGFYTGPQLAAAVAFLKAHPGHVSPITLELGANDVITDFDESTCSPTASAQSDLATMDQNLAGPNGILAQLLAAAQSSPGFSASDLHLLNYYDPFAKECPTSLGFLKVLNDHLAADAARFRVPVVDVYSAFGGDAHMADNVCQGPVAYDPFTQLTQRVPYTWMCNPQLPDLHPTSYGYYVMAQAIAPTLGLPNVSIALRQSGPAGPALAARSEALVQRRALLAAQT